MRANNQYSQKIIYLLFFVCQVSLITGQEAERLYDYVFFENSILPGHYFFSTVSYTGGSYIKNIEGKLPVHDEKAFTAPNALELNFTNGNGSWEAIIEYESIRGMHFYKESDALSFWIYPGNTRLDLLPKVTLNIIDKRRRTGQVLSDLRSASLSMQEYITGVEKLGWMNVKIPLEDFGELEGRPNNIIFSNTDLSGTGRILIDQLELTSFQSQTTIPKPIISTAKAYERHIDITWEPFNDKNVNYIKIYRSTDGKSFKSIGIQRPWLKRFTDYVGNPDETYFYSISLVDDNYNESVRSLSVEGTTQPFNDDELLDMVQEASFRYYWEGAEPYSGMALENIPGRKNMIATGASGFGIMAIIVGAERGFIPREAAGQRLLKITQFLKSCDTYHGAFSHFIDGPTGKTEPFFGERDNGGDLVETSFLFQGLLAARQYFNQDNDLEKSIREGITDLWEAIEWNWYDREKENKFLTWHWSPDKEWIIDHKLIGWNETMITYILAMASPTYSIPVSMYYNGWASQEEKAVRYRNAWGRTIDGSFYTNGKSYHGIQLDVGVSNGGPLFFVHYSYMGLDPHVVTDKYTNYYDNNKNIALINWRYCSENPLRYKGMGATFWGLTASDGPWGYDAIEPNIERDKGTLAPTGALASFPYTPDQSMAALKNMYRNHGQYLWGEYGFKDAINLHENWHSKIYMGLNQAPVTVMIENYRTGLIWNLFMKDEEISETLLKLKDYR